MRIYIAHPFSADVPGNIERVRQICRAVIAEGHLPIAPQLYLPAFIDEAAERELALRLCEQLVMWCDAVWIYGGAITAGMEREIAAAYRRGIPVVSRLFQRSRGAA